MPAGSAERDMTKAYLFGAVALLAFALQEPAAGADLSSKAPAPAAESTSPLDWTGLYFGGHIGIAAGNSTWTATQPGGGSNLSGALDFFQPLNPFDGSGSQFAGLSAGYNYMLPSRFVLGAVADVSFPGSLTPNQDFSSPLFGAANYADTMEMFGSVRGRIGRDVGHWLYYVTGGFAWTYDRFVRATLTPGPAGGEAGTVDTAFVTRTGWTVGAGVEAPIAPHWSAQIEYLYAKFGDTAVPLGGQIFTSNLSTQQVRVGLNFRPDDIKPETLLAGPQSPALDGWAIHGQTTLVSQYAAPFRAPYRGANSLDSNVGRETWDATLFVGRRLWQGAELWVDPEIDQGFGLSNTLGAAGFMSGEAYKVGSTPPYFRLPRAFIRQTIDLGGDQQEVRDDINQLAGKQTANRLILTVGKFGVPDIFDTISYAHDPRNDFLNWTLVDAGTFDYAADAWGYSYGAAAEWYQGDWTLRAGLFDLSNVPNSTTLDRTFTQFQMVYELEHRHELAGQPGRLAVLGFLSRGRMGRFDDAILLANRTATIPDTANVRRYASRPGVNLNFEQQIVPNVSVFGRVGYADGNVEPYDFTDVDRTASLGASLGGKLWGRPDDTFGVAGVVNNITKVHAAYLNAGGLGILVGDGQLPRPGPEQIIETYYSLPLGAGPWKVTGDYQFVVNPGYNRDRGPVSVMALRLHAQF
jgi:high affinity Mn2+ porin